MNETVCLQYGHWLQELVRESLLPSRRFSYCEAND